ncbi:MAG: sulfatase-like hydrolase/transferase, partial [bacterium]|nr:sulfatase-like hydrolase/transferase [bacterium]
MDETDIALPALLQQAGYRTIHAGKAHFGPNSTFGGDPTNIGFDVNIAGHGAGGPGSYLGTANFGTGIWHIPGLEAYHGQDIFATEALTLEMNKAIEQSVTDGVPFFAYMAHYAVHGPFMEDTRFSANYPSLSGNTKAFATMIEGMDKSLGDIIAKLDQLGVAEDTLVIFLSDNSGDMTNTPLRAKKGYRYEGGMRVPMIVGWAKPDGTNSFQASLPVPAASREDDIVACWDMFPTVAAVA